MKCALALAILAASTVPAFAATTILVSTSKTGPTCTTNASYPGAFAATSFSFGGAEPSAGVGVGLGTGKLTLQNLIVSKPFDTCSGALVTQFLTGANLDTVELDELESGAGGSAPSRVLSITLTNARISSYSISSAIGGGGAGQEAINFTFQRACIAAEKQPGTTSKTAPPTVVCYDSTTNTVQ